MPRLKIVLGINSLTESQWPAYNSHLQLFYNIGKRYSDMDLILVNPSRVGIDRMRNLAVEVCLKQKADYLFFLDDDVIPPPDALEQLIAADGDIVSGDVIIRGYPFDHMCFRWIESEKTMRALSSYDPKEGRFINVDAVGCSLTLIKRSLLEKIPSPYFITGTNHTEDVYFCLKARDHAPECSILVDTKLQCGHILWPEIISSFNKKNYKAYFEAQYPDVDDVGTSLKIERVSSDISYESLFKVKDA